MVVNLVEVTSVDQLVDKVRKNMYRSSEEILSKSTSQPAYLSHELTPCLVKASISDDDDIIAGPQKMSLKCPVSAMFYSRTISF